MPVTPITINPMSNSLLHAHHPKTSLCKSNTLIHIHFLIINRKTFYFHVTTDISSSSWCIHRSLVRMRTIIPPSLSNTWDTSWRVCVNLLWTKSISCQSLCGISSVIGNLLRTRAIVRGDSRRLFEMGIISSRSIDWGHIGKGILVSLSRFLRVPLKSNISALIHYTQVWRQSTHEFLVHLPADEKLRGPATSRQKDKYHRRPGDSGELRTFVGEKADIITVLIDCVG